MKVCARLSLIIAVISVLYVIVYFLAGEMGLYYRSWILCFGGILVIWVLPLLGVVWLLILLTRLLKEKRRRNSIMKGICLAVLLVLYCRWANIGFYIWAFSLESEQMITSESIRTTGSLGEVWYHRPVGWFFKKIDESHYIYNYVEPSTAEEKEEP